MNVLLIASVTATPAPQEAAELARLLTSLRDQGAVRLLLAVRGGAVCPVPVPLEVDVRAVPVPVDASLSLSRNLVLAHARKTAAWSWADVVGFPDDDCWYPPGLLAAARRALEGVDVVLGRYGPAPDAVDEARFPAREQPVTAGLVMRSVSSVTMLWRREALARVGDFDERLGVGAPLGSSEDLDLALRALGHRMSLRYCPELVVCHEYRPARVGSYFRGNCAVLALHRGTGGVRALLARRVLGGAVLVLLGRLSSKEYAAGCAVAIRTLRAGATSGCGAAGAPPPGPAAPRLPSTCRSTGR